jgi:hypothetical protein
LGALGLLVDVTIFALEHPDLSAWHLVPARAPEMRVVVRPRAATRVLRHAVHLVDLKSERAPVRQRFERNGGGASERKLTLIQSKFDLQRVESYPTRMSGEHGPLGLVQHLTTHTITNRFHDGTCKPITRQKLTLILVKRTLASEWPKGT